MGKGCSFGGGVEVLACGLNVCILEDLAREA